MSWIQMRDFWTFRPTEVSENKKHLFECRDSKSDTGHSLLVHVAASHSGIVNSNRRFYRPDKMQESIHTWLPQKAKDGTTLRTPRPVLIGHNEQGDVLGRVLEAKYIDESWKYAGDFPIVKDFLFYQRDGRKRKNLYESVDWVVDNLLPLDEYTGLGYTDLGLRITNPEAIRKVLADEYLTVSVGFRTDAAVCSLCHTDWATDGKCGHKIGEIEDGHQMFLIAGSLNNQEVSFINFAADPFATTLSKKVLTDSLEKMFFLGLPIIQQNSAIADGLQLSDGLIFEADMFAAEDPMESVIDMNTLDLAALGTEIKSQELTQARAKEIKDSLTAWSPETDDQKSKKRSLVSTVTAKIRKNGWDKIQDSASDSDKAVTEELRSLMEDGKVEPVVSEPVKDKAECTCGNSEAECVCDAEDAWENWSAATDEDRDFFADTDGIYAELEVELDAAVTDGALTADVVKDAKLSSEKRGELEKGSFCGPNRSFPVTDCAHVTAARRLIGRAKVSDGAKSKILACVSRKAKSLGCGSSDKKSDAVDTFDLALDSRAAGFIDSVVMADAAAPLTTEDRGALVSIIKSLDKSYDNLGVDGPRYALRWAVRAMLNDWDADDEVKWALKRLAEGKDHVVLPQSEIDEKDDTVNGLMLEKDGLAAQIVSLNESRAVILSSAKQTLAQQIVMYNVLKAQDGYRDLAPADITAKVDALAKRHITSLKDSVSDILSGLKFTDSKPTASTSTETMIAVDDHTQITDQTPGAPVTDAVQAEANEAQDLLLKRLRFMSPIERQRFLGRLRHEAAQTK